MHSSNLTVVLSPSVSAPGSSAPAPFELAVPLTPPPRPRVDPDYTGNDVGDTSPRDKEVWSVGKSHWRPK